MKNVTRYSTASLLFVATVVAGYLAGHDRGYKVGRLEWMQLPKIVKTYELESVVIPRVLNRSEPSTHPNGPGPEILTEFVDELKSHVRPNVWEDDKTTTLDMFFPKLAIIVSGNESLHHDIEDYIVTAAKSEASNNKAMDRSR